MYLRNCLKWYQTRRQMKIWHALEKLTYLMICRLFQIQRGRGILRDRSYGVKITGIVRQRDWHYEYKWNNQWIYTDFTTCSSRFPIQFDGNRLIRFRSNKSRCTFTTILDSPCSPRNTHRLLRYYFKTIMFI